MDSIIKKERVRFLENAAQAAVTGKANPGEKAVQLIRQGEVVRGLELTCSCGDVTVVELDYETPQEPPHEASSDA